MIDFVVVSSDLQPSVLDIHLKRGAGHSRVTCWIPWQWQELETPGRAKCVVCWECSLEPSVRKVYNSHLSEHFDQIPREAGDIHSKSTMTCWSSCPQLEGILSSIVVLGVACSSWRIPAAQASSSLGWSWSKIAIAGHWKEYFTTIPLTRFPMRKQRLTTQRLTRSSIKMKILR